MKKLILLSSAALLALSTQAFAWKGRTVACYDKVWVPPKYATSMKKVMDAKTKYEHSGGLIKKVVYDAVYVEVRKKVSDGHWLMKEVPCPCDC